MGGLDDAGAWGLIWALGWALVAVVAGLKLSTAAAADQGDEPDYGAGYNALAPFERANSAQHN